MCVHADGCVHEGVCACVGRTEVEVGCLSYSLSTIYLHFLNCASFVCTSVCAWAHVHGSLMLRSDDNLQELALFHHVGSGNQTQVCRLGRRNFAHWAVSRDLNLAIWQVLNSNSGPHALGQGLYQLSHLPNSCLGFNIDCCGILF